jgi:hypothetical protein
MRTGSSIATKFCCSDLAVGRVRDRKVASGSATVPEDQQDVEPPLHFLPGPEGAGVWPASTLYRNFRD